MKRNSVLSRISMVGVAVVAAAGMMPLAAVADQPDQLAAANPIICSQDATDDVNAFLDALKAIPDDPSKLDLSDSKAITEALAKALNYVKFNNGEIVLDDVEGVDMSEVNAGIAKATKAYEKLFELVKAEEQAVKKAKVSSVSAVAKKKSAVVTWKKISGDYTYEVYYSTKKGKGYKLAGTTSKAKYTVKKLKSNKKYFFKVRPSRVVVAETVSGRFSAVASAKVK